MKVDEMEDPRGNQSRRMEGQEAMALLMEDYRDRYLNLVWSSSRSPGGVEAARQHAVNVRQEFELVDGMHEEGAGLKLIKGMEHGFALWNVAVQMKLLALNRMIDSGRLWARIVHGEKEAVGRVGRVSRVKFETGLTPQKHQNQSGLMVTLEIAPMDGEAMYLNEAQTWPRRLRAVEELELFEPAVVQMDELVDGSVVDQVVEIDPGDGTALRVSLAKWCGPRWRPWV